MCANALSCSSGRQLQLLFLTQCHSFSRRMQVWCATLSREAYEAALQGSCEDALSCSSGRQLQLLLLTERVNRSPLVTTDIASERAGWVIKHRFLQGF